MQPIQMVDLKGQYLRIKNEIDNAIQSVVDSTGFIAGPEVKHFAISLGQYAEVPFVVTCGNGTDALQIALMALDLKPGDEVIIPAFTYIATAEVVLLLGLTPVFADVDKATFNVTAETIAQVITPKTRVIIPVHLFGQSAPMEEILDLAEKNGIQVIEDNAQGLGGSITFSNNKTFKNGSTGLMSCTSFFPSKNLGCFGDGGAIFTKDEKLYNRLKMIANHGQKKKYHHDIVGCNSRLDTLQAAILQVKLPHLDDYCSARRQVAAFYDRAFAGNKQLSTPFCAEGVYHVYHQYTLKIHSGISRDHLRERLAELGIPSNIYYPVPCHKNKMFAHTAQYKLNLPVAQKLAQSVLSLPIHTEMDDTTMQFITEQVNALSTEIE